MDKTFLDEKGGSQQLFFVFLFALGFLFLFLFFFYLFQICRVSSTSESPYLFLSSTNSSQVSFKILL